VGERSGWAVWHVGERSAKWGLSGELEAESSEVKSLR